jgi:hypothetical protein
MEASLTFRLPSPVFILMKVYPTIPLSGRSNLGQRYLQEYNFVNFCTCCFLYNSLVWISVSSTFAYFFATFEFCGILRPIFRPVGNFYLRRRADGEAEKESGSHLSWSRPASLSFHTSTPYPRNKHGPVATKIHFKNVNGFQSF